MSKYADIIARLEKAEDFDRDLDRDIGIVLMGWRYEEVEGFGQMIYIPDENAYYPDHPGSLTPSITSSIDAAVALVERMLPDQAILLGYGQDALTKPWARISVPCGSSHGATLPLAILRALFRALDAQEASE